MLRSRNKLTFAWTCYDSLASLNVETCILSFTMHSQNFLLIGSWSVATFLKATVDNSLLPFSRFHFFSYVAFSFSLQSNVSKKLSGPSFRLHPHLSPLPFSLERRREVENFNFFIFCHLSLCFCIGSSTYLDLIRHCFYFGGL